MTTDLDLARRVDVAQSILASPAAEQARRMERALAESCAAIAAAMGAAQPASKASARALAGGFAIYAGLGSPLTQGLGMGHDGVVTSEELDRVEAHLTPDGHGGRQLEITPFVDPSLTALLAERAYRVHEWQIVWTRSLDDALPAPAQAADPALRVRRAREGEQDACLRAIMAGFLESDDVPEDALDMMRATTLAPKHETYVALLGDEVIGGGALAWHDGIAFVNGSGVRGAFRRRGAQAALLRARLERARELGCAVAYSVTLPGTSSRRNMERSGFRVAYPKVLMLRP
jgi:hypothetical protein